AWECTLNFCEGGDDNKVVDLCDFMFSDGSGLLNGMATNFPSNALYKFPDKYKGSKEALKRDLLRAANSNDFSLNTAWSRKSRSTIRADELVLGSTRYRHYVTTARTFKTTKWWLPALKSRGYARINQTIEKVDKSLAEERRPSGQPRKKRLAHLNLRFSCHQRTAFGI
ncbi:MAG: hypothetical protein ACREBR_02735, partial [bacterium]